MRVDQIRQPVDYHQDKEEENGPDVEQEPDKINESDSDDIGKDVPEEGPVSYKPRHCTAVKSSDLKRRCRIL